MSEYLDALRALLHDPGAHSLALVLVYLMWRQSRLERKVDRIELSLLPPSEQAGVRFLRRSNRR